MKVSVLGAGNGGVALTFHLSQMGHEVLLYQDKQFEHLFKEIKDTGKIVALKEVDGVQAEIHGEVSIAKATTDIKEACEHSNILMLIVPSFAQGITFKLSLPYLTPNHVFISLPGNFAFLEYSKIMYEASGAKGKDYISALKGLNTVKAFVESSTIPYACRLLGGNNVFIGGVKKRMEAGVLPHHKTDEVIDSIKTLFTLHLHRSTNVIETGLCNINVTAHPAITIYNAARIESTKGNFLFYNEGLTPCTQNVINALDKERLAVAASLGLNVDDDDTTWKKWYTLPNENAEEKGESMYNFIKAPDTLNNRYITEDLCYLLLPVVNYIAKPLGIPTPMGDAIITSARVLSGLALEPARHFHAPVKDYMDL